jgi:hypothetical protein
MPLLPIGTEVRTVSRDQLLTINPEIVNKCSSKLHYCNKIFTIHSIKIDIYISGIQEKVPLAYVLANQQGDMCPYFWTPEMIECIIIRISHNDENSQTF